ncbi:phosphate ABC transporter substrate-binding protein PstS [Kitasatospora sp. NBC_01250]|uniref:phosphate ABC transporter substrate-binding protein PstS n=1 Tax=unclassified Kitasatospora TaxID=2633591 RepID=UPI002E1426DF|nr:MULTISPECIES: phosphate ABC transporter substrate-binding protein PstS [unclassified Kitasatospora]WSJ68614.1 phosphate ABC transporter substrate-binding protein PstS [Kitasatospora sp. NBC_01302]
MKLQRNGRTKALAIGAVALVSSLSLAACGSDNNTTKTSSTASGASSAAAITCASKQSPLQGAGSTAQGNAVDVWKAAYGDACSGSQVSYNGVGSGAGVAQFNQGKVAFAGTDFALKASDIDASKAVCQNGGQAIDLPMVAGLVTLVFNVPGVDNLTLDGQTAAKIFDGQITKWNDPAIAALNPGVNLPGDNIQTFHRSDDSGTSYNLTSYFAKTSNGAWSYAPNKTWQGKGGQSATGSAGVAAQIKQTSDSIGYVELSYAQNNSLKTASISTGATKAVEATAANAATTLANSTVIGTGNDLALQLDYGTKAEGAYPIVLVTYEIACDKGNNAATLPALKSFFNYIASNGGQQAIATKGYVPLPTPIASKVQAAIGNLS